MRILSLILAILLSSHVIAKTKQVELVTTEGVIKLELYSDKAPKTVANFLTYVSSGYYANTQFHRVIAGFMIQGGGFDLQGDRKATGAPIVNEANNGL
ncbi:MAG TPA: cyclophilin, partial [Oceanospirillaceae bacterium]|nr:cyclophilin [Oceanospirillaceae bacterium]